MRSKAPSDARLRSRFAALARLVAVVGSRSNSVFSEAFDELAEELRPQLAMAFSLKDDVLLLLAEHRLGSVVPMPWRQFRTSDALALPMQAALRSRRPSLQPLHTPEGGAAFAAWGPVLARDVDVAIVVPAVHGADVLAVTIFFFNERALDEGILQFLHMVSALLGLALALQGEREREATRSAELAETTRLATLGTLSATVAHELRGPAGALALLVPELQQALAGASAARGEALEPLLNDMRTCVERIGGLCGQLGNLNYHDEAPETFDLRSVAAEVVALVRVHAQGAGVITGEELAPVSVVGRRDQIGQVILNLALNAIDACRDVAAGGVKHIIVRTAFAQGAAVIEVADSGPGLSEGAVDRVFQPFFTTKPRGKGTGLGLSVSRDIVRSHRGHIEVGRSIWGGALFRVVLPAYDPEAASFRLAQSPAASRAFPAPPSDVAAPRPRSGLTPLPPSRSRPDPTPEPPPARPRFGALNEAPHARLASSPDAPPPPRPRFASSPDAPPPPRPPLGSSPEMPPAPCPRLRSSPEMPPAPRPRLGSSPDAPPPPRARLGSSPDAPPPPRPRFASSPETPLASPQPPPTQISPRSPFGPPRVPSRAAGLAAPPPPVPRPRLGSSPETAPRPRPDAEAPAAPAPLRVLFVDDDALLLRTMKRVMRGCEVTLASTIEQARDALEAGAPFDVVVTDVNMPGGSGLDLHRRLALEKPALVHKLIFLSGGALTAGDAAYLRSSGCLCLPKPIAPDALLDTIRSVARAGKPSIEASLTLRPPTNWR